MFKRQKIRFLTSLYSWLRINISKASTAGDIMHQNWLAQPNWKKIRHNRPWDWDHLIEIVSLLH